MENVAVSTWHNDAAKQHDRRPAMNVNEAALQVLRDADGALSDHEISDRILAEGLWQTEGQEANALAALRHDAFAKYAFV